MNILLVNDSTFGLPLKKQCLTEMGAHVYVTQSRHDALQLIGQRPYDMLLLDSIIPAREGDEAGTQMDHSLAVAEAFKKANPDASMILESIALKGLSDWEERYNKAGVNISMANDLDAIARHLAEKLGHPLPEARVPKRPQIEARTLLPIREIRSDNDFKLREAAVNAVAIPNEAREAGNQALAQFLHVKRKEKKIPVERHKNAIVMLRRDLNDCRNFDELLEKAKPFYSSFTAFHAEIKYMKDAAVIEPLPPLYTLNDSSAILTQSAKAHFQGVCKAMGIDAHKAIDRNNLNAGRYA